MRTKSFVMSMGLAASVWLTGCQTATQSRVARSAATGEATCTSKTCKEGAADEAVPKARSEKTTRVAKSSGPQSKIPPATCSTCAKCAGENNSLAIRDTAPIAQVAAKSNTCSTCAASAGAIYADSRGIPQAPIQPMPQSIASLPPGQHQVIVMPANNGMPQGTNQIYVVPASNGMPNQAYVVPQQPAYPAPNGQYQMPQTQAYQPMPNQAIVVHNSPMVAPNSPMMTHQVGVPMQPGTVMTSPGSMSVQQQPMAPSYGAGVDVVTNQQPIEMPTTIPGERTVSNNTMTVRFGQANNYQVVVGQVYQFRRAWKLRYAAVESDDKYGGSLSLIGEGFDNLKDGQMVRVEGVILPSDDRAAGARYQVQRIEVIEPDIK